MKKVIWPWVTLGIVFVFILVAYIFNFYLFPWSNKPSDWGAIGDYFGGLLNPLVSALALFFLIKAYLSQKEELIETRDVLKKTEESNRKTSESQKRLVDTQHLTSLINSEYQRLNYLYKELDRCTTALVNNRYFIDRYCKELSRENTQNYRKALLQEVSEITEKVKELDNKLAKLNT